MELFEIVMTLNGKVNAVGDESIDPKRFENLKNLTGLIDKLLFIVRNEAVVENSYEESVLKSAKFARGYLKGVVDELHNE